MQPILSKKYATNSLKEMCSQFFQRNMQQCQFSTLHSPTPIPWQWQGHNVIKSRTCENIWGTVWKRTVEKSLGHVKIFEVARLLAFSQVVSECQGCEKNIWGKFVKKIFTENITDHTFWTCQENMSVHGIFKVYLSQCCLEMCLYLYILVQRGYA